MSKLGNLGARLHHGEVGYDFIELEDLVRGFLLITVLAIVGLAVRGLHMGIEFQGGAVFTTPKNMSASVAQAETYAEEASGHDAIVQKLGDGSLHPDRGHRHQHLGQDQDGALPGPEGRGGADQRGPGRSQAGEQIAGKAWQGLGIFLFLVVIYLAIAFEWRMAVAAFIALIHDLTITVGIYALVGFEVTPAR
ncbi:protein translocase subunit SecF [Streptomyces hirsutus]